MGMRQAVAMEKKMGSRSLWGKSVPTEAKVVDDAELCRAQIQHLCALQATDLDDDTAVVVQNQIENLLIPPVAWTDEFRLYSTSRKVHEHVW